MRLPEFITLVLYCSQKSLFITVSYLAEAATFIFHVTHIIGSRRRRKMKRCARCNKKASLSGGSLLDKEFCDECLFDIDGEIRERRIIPDQASERR